MSQQKVDAHKKEKAGRKDQVAKQKKIRKISRIVTLIICLALVALIVFLVVRSRMAANTDVSESDGIELTTDDTSDFVIPEVVEETTDDGTAEGTETEDVFEEGGSETAE